METSDLAVIREQLHALERSSIQCVVMTRPRGLGQHDFLTIAEDLFELVREDGVLWSWGNIDGLDTVGWEICPGLYDFNLWACFKNRRALPTLSPPRIGDYSAREMPPAIIEYVITMSTRKEDTVLDLFNRSAIADAVCRATGRRCTALGSTMTWNIIVPPPDGWPGRPELTDTAVIRRFENNLIQLEGHVLWTRATSAGGYGHFKIKGRTQYAHRFSWERTFGPIGVLGVDVSHSCGIRRCCNVDHLRLADHLDNLAERRIRERYTRSNPRQFP